MALVNQTSKRPTRKITAMIISGMVIGVAQSLLRYFWPDHPFAPYVDDVDIWLQGAIMLGFGYMTKERADEPVSETLGVQEPPVGGVGSIPLNPLREVEEERGEVGSGEQTPCRQGGETQ